MFTIELPFLYNTGMTKFIIKTLGCKTNQLESAAIAEILTDAGYFETENILEADYYILNSCSVTHTADTKNLAYLRRAKRENPHIKTILTGCMAQLEKEKLIENNIADFVIGNYEKYDIAEILSNGSEFSVSDIFSHDKFRYKPVKHAKRTRAAVKIQDGCNNRCSYCTIPYARGISRSDSIEHIVSQINLYASEGYFETVLTGIHIGQWGLDFTPRRSLMNLLEKAEETNIHRYRLSSLNPFELPEELIDFLAASKKFCPHFHLSLQSCCDKTLKAMNRRYTAQNIKELVSYINKKFPRAFIGCDIIAGFPDETGEDFLITVENLKELKLSQMHIFPYSRRRGTIADKMSGQIEEAEKKRRCEILQKISEDKHYQFLKSNIGAQLEAVIENKRESRTGLLKGASQNYINVLISGSDNLKNTLQKVIIKDFSLISGKMSAEIIKEEV